MRNRALIIILIAISLLFTACAINPTTKTHDKGDIIGGLVNSAGDEDADGDSVKDDGNGAANDGSGDEQPDTPDLNALTEAEIAELQNIYQ